MKEILEKALETERERSAAAVERAVERTQETVRSKMEDVAKVIV